MLFPEPDAYLGNVTNVPNTSRTNILISFYYLAEPDFKNMSQAKLRRESNPKLVQRFPLLAAFQATAP